MALPGPHRVNNSFGFPQHIVVEVKECAPITTKHSKSANISLEECRHGLMFLLGEICKDREKIGKTNKKKKENGENNVKRYSYVRVYMEGKTLIMWLFVLHST